MTEKLRELEHLQPAELEQLELSGTLTCAAVGSLAVSTELDPNALRDPSDTTLTAKQQQDILCILDLDSQYYGHSDKKKLLAFKNRFAEIVASSEGDDPATRDLKYCAFYLAVDREHQHNAESLFPGLLDTIAAIEPRGLYGIQKPKAQAQSYKKLENDLVGVANAVMLSSTDLFDADGARQVILKCYYEPRKLTDKWTAEYIRISGPLISGLDSASDYDIISRTKQLRRLYHDYRSEKEYGETTRNAARLRDISLEHLPSHFVEARYPISLEDWDRNDSNIIADVSEMLELGMGSFLRPYQRDKLAYFRQLGIKYEPGKHDHDLVNSIHWDVKDGMSLEEFENTYGWLRGFLKMCPSQQDKGLNLPQARVVFEYLKDLPSEQWLSETALELILNDNTFMYDAKQKHEKGQDARWHEIEVPNIAEAFAFLEELGINASTYIENTYNGSVWDAIDQLLYNQDHLRTVMIDLGWKDFFTSPEFSSSIRFQRENIYQSFYFSYDKLIKALVSGPLDDYPNLDTVKQILEFRFGDEELRDLDGRAISAVRRMMLQLAEKLILAKNTIIVEMDPVESVRIYDKLQKAELYKKHKILLRDSPLLIIDRTRFEKLVDMFESPRVQELLAVDPKLVRKMTDYIAKESDFGLAHSALKWMVNDESNYISNVLSAFHKPDTPLLARDSRKTAYSSLVRAPEQIARYQAAIDQGFGRDFVDNFILAGMGIRPKRSLHDSLMILGALRPLTWDQTVELERLTNELLDRMPQVQDERELAQLPTNEGRIKMLLGNDSALVGKYFEYRSIAVQNVAANNRSVADEEPKVAEVMGNLRPLAHLREDTLRDAKTWLRRSQDIPVDRIGGAWRMRDAAANAGINRNDPRAVLSWMRKEVVRSAYEKAVEEDELPDTIKTIPKEEALKKYEALNKYYMFESATKLLERFYERVDRSTQQIFTAQRIELADGWSAEILAKDDIRGLTIGLDTGCCMHDGDSGRDAMWAGISDPNYGFFTLYDSSGQLRAQSLTYVNPDHPTVVVCDNIEVNRGSDKKGIVANYRNAWLKIIQVSMPQIKRVNIGTQYTTTGSWLEEDGDPVPIPKSTAIRSDADEQKSLINLKD